MKKLLKFALLLFILQSIFVYIPVFSLFFEGFKDSFKEANISIFDVIRNDVSDEQLSVFSNNFENVHLPEINNKAKNFVNKLENISSNFTNKKLDDYKTEYRTPEDIESERKEIINNSLNVTKVNQEKISEMLSDTFEKLTIEKGE